MSVTGTFDVRRLVEQTRDLTVVVPKREHPIGLHLRDSHYLRADEGQPRIRLPKFAAGLAQMREILARDILDLDASESALAWNILLDKPALCAPLRTPSVTELQGSGFAVSEDDAPYLRAVALAAVCNRKDEKEQATGGADGGISARFGGAGRLVVVTDKRNPEVSVNAWADVRWMLSGNILCREIEILHNDATPSARESGTRSSVTLLLGDNIADILQSAQDNASFEGLSAIAAIHGFDINILQRPRSHAGTVLEHVRRTPPSLLVIAAPQDAKVDAIIGAYRATGVAPHVYQLGDCTPDQLMDSFRETMGAAAGISPALFLSTPFRFGVTKSADPIDPGPEIPGIWPVPMPGREMIHGTFGKYVENASDGLWYTRDKAQHAGSQVKRYRRNGRQLEHDADIAADGQVIAKHKGYIGDAVSLDDMRGV